MKNLKPISKIFLGILIVLCILYTVGLLNFADGLKSTRYIILAKDDSLNTMIPCNFDKFLNNEKTPKLAIELYNNKAKLSEEPLSYFGNLKSTDFQKRAFYFRVITNSYKGADGSYSEGLANFGKEFIENNTENFVSYFDKKQCFNDYDLYIWADIVISEFLIIREVEYDKLIINDYTKKLKTNCKSCSKTQQNTIDKFEKIIKRKWSDYLNKTEK